ncbi:MAG: FHA domain-containing protein, partial [Tabrizicola sp.]|uniref:FHA domain-containing protein n=1 Tax=Tabrizicola sp. TaxID=2005166 RepID=UPI003BAEA6ED
SEAAPRRPTRTKTRVLGFEAQPTAVVPLFEGLDGSPIPTVPAAPGKGYVMFPAGWLVVKDGPGKGASFALSQGVSQIGRGVDQTVALDFGDMAISRQNHAAIAYDAATHEFHIGHGGKSNLVRLNGKPLLSTESAGDGDEIQIGETTLVLKALCTPAFNWSSFEAEGDGHDMAIA